MSDLAPETGNDSCYARPGHSNLRRIGRRTVLRGATVLLATRMLAGARQAVADDWGRQLPDIRSNFIFGYGSLIETESRESTEGHGTVAIPVRVSAALGFVRAWADRCTCGFTALGLRRPRASEMATTINGAIFPVQMGRDMAAYDAREAGYARVSVPLALRGGRVAASSRARHDMDVRAYWDRGRARLGTAGALGCVSDVAVVH